MVLEELLYLLTTLSAKPGFTYKALAESVSVDIRFSGLDVVFFFLLDKELIKSLNSFVLKLLFIIVLCIC